MIAPEGKKWIITVTVPNKGKYACGGVDNRFALLPLGDGTKEVQLRGVLVFEDSLDASSWLKGFLKSLPDKESRKSFLELSPDLGLVEVMGQGRILH